MYRWQLLLVIIFDVNIISRGDEVDLCEQPWNITCSCEKNVEEGLDFYCPQKNNFKINVLVTNDIVQLKCDKTMSIDDYEAISSINFAKINRVQNIFIDDQIFKHEKFFFQNCLIPPNGFESIIRKLKVAKTNTLYLDDCLPSDHTFRSEHFNGFSEIIALGVQGTETLTLSSNAFEYLADITKLVLTLPKLRGMNGELFRKQTNLEHLWLNQTTVNITKDFFIHLSSITELYIQNSVQENTLQSNVFDLLYNVREIILAENSLTSLPPGLFHSNIHLNTLTILEPILATQPDDLLVNLKHLDRFTLSYTSIETIHADFFEKTTQLTFIDMSENKLTFLPDGVFRNLIELQRINLANNRLTKLPQSLVSLLFSIQSIDLHNNSLKTYPVFYHSPAYFEVLDLSDNQIDRVTSANLWFPTPKSIYLRNNSLKTIDFSDISSTLYKVDSINTTIQIELHLHDNPIDCDDRLTDFILYMENPNKSLKINVHGGECSTPSALAQKQLSQLDFNVVAQQGINFNTTYCSVDCNCNFRRVDRMLVMKCTKQGLRQLRRFPNTQDLLYRHIELNVENQNVTEFPDLKQIPGVANVLIVNANNNNIKHFSREMFPSTLKWLDLSKNKLVSIDRDLIKSWEASNTLQKLWLSGNPWECNCNTQLMRAFIYSNPSRVNDYLQIKCANKAGKRLHEIDNLCTDRNIIIIALCLSALFVTFLFTCYYKYREFIYVWLYGTFGRSIGKYLSEKTFDAFISFAEPDKDYVFNDLAPGLENGPEKYQLCIHTRDWIAAPIIEQIYDSVRNSRFTIVVLSQNFLRSKWGVAEFRAAQLQANEEKRSNVIMVMYGVVNDDDIKDGALELQAYLQSNTYLKWDDPWFLKKLRYSMRRSSRDSRRLRTRDKEVFEMTNQQVE